VDAVGWPCSSAARSLIKFNLFIGTMQRETDDQNQEKSSKSRSLLSAMQCNSGGNEEFTTEQKGAHVAHGEETEQVCKV
jgi:hypothetical protein